jgi:hypothetical protein
MNDPERDQSQFVRFGEVFFHDAFNIPRRNRVEVEDVMDRNMERFFFQVD